MSANISDSAFLISQIDVSEIQSMPWSNEVLQVAELAINITIMMIRTNF